MKRFLPIFIIAFALVSCEKEVDLPIVEKNPIIFGEVETRAAVNSVDDIKESGFGVFGYVSGVVDPLLTNEKVYWKDNSEWHYDNTRYWIPDHTFHFFAYYPYDDETDATEPISNVVVNGDGEVGYQLSFVTPEAADFDLLSAYASVDTGDAEFNAANPVQIQFGHEMVNVNLKIWRDGAKHKNDNMRVKSVTLSNVTWGGLLTKTDGGSTSWTNTERRPLLSGTAVEPKTEIGAAVRISNGIETGGGEPCSPFGENGLLLIPTTISGSNAVTLSIAYELRLQGGGDDEWLEYSHNAILPATTWQAGTMVTYNVLLSNIVDITFHYISTTVDPWGAPQLGGTIIIK